MNEEKEISHPSFGMLEMSRISGHAQLFGVEYPQQHFVRIRVHPASVKRAISHDWYHSRAQTIIEIDLSEVQFARAVTSMNTTGVPCTIARRCDVDGTLHDFQCPAPDVAKKEQFESEMRKKAQIAGQKVEDSIAKVRALLDAGAPKKSDLRAILDDLTTSHRELVANLPFVVKSAEEAIDASLQSAKAEISAYHEHALQQLGERAIGRAMLEDNKTARDVLQLDKTE